MHIIKDVIPCPHLYLAEYGRQLQVELAFRYAPDLPPAPYDGARLVILRKGGEHFYVHRHAHEEDRAWRFLSGCGLTRGRMGVLTGTGEKAFLFLFQQLPRLIAAGWEIEGQERLRFFRTDAAPLRLSAHVSELLPAALSRGTSTTPSPGRAPSPPRSPHPLESSSPPVLPSARSQFLLDLNLELGGERLSIQSVNRLLQDGQVLLPLSSGAYVPVSVPLRELLQALRNLGVPRGDDQRVVDRAGLLWLKLLFEQAEMLEDQFRQVSQPSSPPRETRLTAPTDVQSSPESHAPQMSHQGLHRITGDAPWQRWLQHLTQLEHAVEGVELATVATPKGFVGTLRPYQEQGLAWLLALRDAEMGGILADDMGLGKTIQLLSLLLHEHSERITSPTLVIAPTSVLENWAAEASRFAPSLKTVVLQGPSRRKLLPQLSDAQLVITSYALVRRDIDWLLSLYFHRVVLDEAQNIKNHQSQTARAIRRLRAHHRLTLTGTPIENRLEELWSQFAFLMPDLLGTLDAFKQRYVVPIEQGLALEQGLPLPSPVGFKAGMRLGMPSDVNLLISGKSTLESLQRTALLRQQELAWRVGPFILRRLKQDVAQELPPRTELVLHCALKPGQKALYNALLQDSREHVLAQVRGQGLMAARWTVLVTLLRLRQVCCDPRLLEDVPLNGQAYIAFQQWKESGELSAKVELLLEQLTLLLGRGHRVLVFSQFVRMLELLEELLKARQIPYEYLDGQTTDRLARVEKFNESNIPVFLLSLKAGGTGLNLTGADYVIHFDPWWNPAVEAQATDRTHRIGQTRPVFSYKLIASGTVEERLLGLQSRKRALADGILAPEHVSQGMPAGGVFSSTAQTSGFVPSEELPSAALRAELSSELEWEVASELPPTQRLPTESSQLEYSAMEGSAVEGSAVEGSAVEGSAVEGSAVEGSAVEGSAVEGTTGQRPLAGLHRGFAQALRARGQSFLKSLTAEDLAWLLEVAADAQTDN